MRSLLDDVDFAGHLEDRVSSLSVAQRHLLELAKAFAVTPRLLILDEPTAPLSPGLRRAALRARCASWRPTARPSSTSPTGSAEVREIADRVTVLRDGKVRGTSAVDEITDDELLAHDRRAHARVDLPAQARARHDEAPLLRVEGLSGHGFDDVSLQRAAARSSASPGIVGNGQRALLRALAGLDRVDRDRSASAASSSRGAHCSRAPPTCRPTG